MIKSFVLTFDNKYIDAAKIPRATPILNIVLAVFARFNESKYPAILLPAAPIPSNISPSLSRGFVSASTTLIIFQIVNSIPALNPTAIIAPKSIPFIKSTNFEANDFIVSQTVVAPFLRPRTIPAIKFEPIHSPSVDGE